MSKARIMKSRHPREGEMPRFKYFGFTVLMEAWQHGQEFHYNTYNTISLGGAPSDDCKGSPMHVPIPNPYSGLHRLKSAHTCQVLNPSLMRWKTSYCFIISHLSIKYAYNKQILFVRAAQPFCHRLASHT